MTTLVVYKSKTGFAKKYAEMIAQATGAQLMPLANVSSVVMDRFETIVFGGGLYAGSINGIKKAKALYAKSSAKRMIVFACGATPNAAKDAIEAVWNKNLTDTELSYMPHFYMQGGLAYDKMSPVDRAVMKMVAVAKHSAGLKKSHDIMSDEYIKPLVDCVLNN